MGPSTFRLCHRLGGRRVVLAALVIVMTIVLVGHRVAIGNDLQPQGPVATFEVGDHPDLTFLRKYGKVKPAGVISGLPTEEELQNMTKKELTYIYHSHLDNVDYQCHRKLRLGSAADGGWGVCDDYEFGLIWPCVVYSFGIANDFSFDDDVAKLYRCNVFSFDPTMRSKEHMRSTKVRFLKVGLGGAGGALSSDINKHDLLANGGSLKSLTDIKRMLGHTNTTIDVMKIDIESSEWSALPDMLIKGELTHVRQLLMEFHTQDATKATLRERLLVLAKLEALGFRRFHTHTNEWCKKLRGEYPVMRTGCYEVLFVNTGFKRQKEVT
ncbi:probable methyltransferase-like protein 24 [Littorina saxatilis]|uniref:Methyltransferase domain-containing protein n=1 Tax=Littorina saxatilis TaxID=31220 RepID=A0AAN9B808_9CAEN